MKKNLYLHFSYEFNGIIYLTISLPFYAHSDACILILSFEIKQIASNNI